MTTMSTTSMKLDATKNRVTVSQIGKHCGEIRFTFCVDGEEITLEMQNRAERELKADPQHQQGYYEMLLVTPDGEEMDYALNVI
jgi:hypothetical protein